MVSISFRKLSGSRWELKTQNHLESWHKNLDDFGFECCKSVRSTAHHLAGLGMRFQWRLPHTYDTDSTLTGQQPAAATSPSSVHVLRWGLLESSKLCCSVPLSEFFHFPAFHSAYLASVPLELLSLFIIFNELFLFWWGDIYFTFHSAKQKATGRKQNWNIALTLKTLLNYFHCVVKWSVLWLTLS